MLKWVVALGVLDALTLALTIHTNVTYHAGANGPTVMPLGAVLGWVIVVLLTGAIAFIVKESSRSR